MAELPVCIYNLSLRMNLPNSRVVALARQNEAYLQPMKRVSFFMMGGFLGAGKTTALARLASHYGSEGKNVGLVTNDQAYDLVDTQSLRAQGFIVGEVPGACFC